MTVKFLNRYGSPWAVCEISATEAENLKRAQIFNDPVPDDGTYIPRSPGRPGEYGAQGWTGLLIDQHSVQA